LQITWYNGKFSFAFFKWGISAIRDIQPELSLTFIGVRTMALKTPIGQDGPDMEVKVDR